MMKDDIIALGEERLRARGLDKPVICGILDMPLDKVWYHIIGS